MAIDLLKKITEQLGYQPLIPVSAKTLEVKGNSNDVAQGTIPAVLSGFLSLADTDTGLDAITNYNGDDWPTILFNNKRDEALKNLSTYTGLNENQLLPEINKISQTVVNIIKNEIGDPDDKPTAIKSFLKDQKNIVLNHLPASLEMGKILNNEVIDDHTNKMQGPFSSLLNKISDSFDKNDTEEKLDEKSRNF